MTGPFTREYIAEGVSFIAIQDPKFKHNRLSLSMIMPLEEGKLSERAIVPYILRQGTRKYPDVTKINERLSDLYGASLEASVEKFGAYQLLNIGMVGIDSRFAFEGEDMVCELANQLADILLVVSTKQLFIYKFVHHSPSCIVLSPRAGFSPVVTLRHSKIAISPGI